MKYFISGCFLLFLSGCAGYDMFVDVTEDGLVSTSYYQTNNDKYELESINVISDGDGGKSIIVSNYKKLGFPKTVFHFKRSKLLVFNDDKKEKTLFYKIKKKDGHHLELESKTKNYRGELLDKYRTLDGVLKNPLRLGYRDGRLQLEGCSSSTRNECFIFKLKRV